MSAKPLGQQLQGVFSGKFESLTAPDCSVELGEVVLGTLKSEQAKALWSIADSGATKDQIILKDLMQKMEDVADDKEARRKIMRDVYQMKNRYEVLMGLFWEMTCEEFPQARDVHVAVGIRKNWQVVVFKSGASGMGGILGSLFG